MSNPRIQKFPTGFVQFKHLYWIEPFNDRLDGNDFYPIEEDEVEVKFCRIKNVSYVHFTLPCWFAYGVYFPGDMYWRKNTKNAIIEWEKKTGNKKEAEKKILAKIKKEFVKDLNITKAWAMKLRGYGELDDKKRSEVGLAFIHEMGLKLKKVADK